MAGRSGRLGSAALGLSVSESQLNDIDGIQASTRPLLDQISLCAGPCAEPAGPEGPEARCLSWEFIVQGRSRLSTATERCRCHRAGQWGMARGSGQYKGSWGRLMGKGQHPEGESSDAGKLFPGGRWVVHTADRSWRGRSVQQGASRAQLGPGLW